MPPLSTALAQEARRDQWRRPMTQQFHCWGLSYRGDCLEDRGRHEVPPLWFEEVFRRKGREEEAVKGTVLDEELGIK